MRTMHPQTREHLLRAMRREAYAFAMYLLYARFRRLREDERANRDQFLAVLRDLDPADPAEWQTARQNRDQGP